MNEKQNEENFTFWRIMCFEALSGGLYRVFIKGVVLYKCPQVNEECTSNEKLW